jgi:hypothetical protein
LISAAPAVARRRLNVQCSTNLTTEDLETEVFLHILHHCAEYVDAADDTDGAAGRAAAAACAMDGDGMGRWAAGGGGAVQGAEGFRAGAVGRCGLLRPPADGCACAPPTVALRPPDAEPRSAGGARRPGLAERLLAPLRIGVRELLPGAIKFGSAVTVSAVGRQAAEKMAAQLMRSHIQWQSAAAAAAAAARAGGAAAGGAAAREAALAAAQKGLTSAAARYGALRGAMAFVGPVMWGWLAVDLGLMAIGTDYARIIRAVFVLAQARLLRTHGWCAAAPEEGPSSGGGGGANSDGARGGDGAAAGPGAPPYYF